MIFPYRVHEPNLRSSDFKSFANAHAYTRWLESQHLVAGRIERLEDGAIWEPVTGEWLRPL